MTSPRGSGRRPRGRPQRRLFVDAVFVLTHVLPPGSGTLRRVSGGRGRGAQERRRPVTLRPVTIRSLLWPPGAPLCWAFGPTVWDVSQGGPAPGRRKLVHSLTSLYRPWLCTVVTGIGAPEPPTNHPSKLRALRATGKGVRRPPWPPLLLRVFRPFEGCRGPGVCTKDSPERREMRLNAPLTARAGAGLWPRGKHRVYSGERS